MKRGKYSQYDQEQWILDQFEPGYRGWAMDLGANDGRFYSNTLLAEEAGWTVLCVEADPRYADQLRQSRKLWCSCAVAEPGDRWRNFRGTASPGASDQALRYDGAGVDLRVVALTIDELLSLFAFPKLDVLSMDIEGGEVHALEGFDIARWKPKVMVIEDLGHTDLIDEILAPHGYVLSGEREYDRLFLRENPA